MSIDPDRLYVEAVEPKSRARRVLLAQHRYFALAHLCSAHDSRTGDTVPIPLADVLSRLEVANPNLPVYWQDRVEHLHRLTASAVRDIIHSPRSTIRREVVMTPVQRVAYLNAVGISWLNRQPGRTKRDKLRSCTKGVPAIMSRFSLDTVENRIFKHYVLRLHELLVSRETAFNSVLPEEQDRTVLLVERWLRDDAVQGIRSGYTGEINNAVLGDGRYNLIWRMWGQLQCLDESLARDDDALEAIELQQVFWDYVHLLHSRFGIAFPQQFCFWDDDRLGLYAGKPGSREIAGMCGSTIVILKWSDQGTGAGITLKVGNKRSVKLPSSSVDENAIAALLPPAQLTPCLPKAESAAVLDFCACDPWYSEAQAPRKAHRFPVRLMQQYVHYASKDGGEEWEGLDQSQAQCVLFGESDVWMGIPQLLDPQFIPDHKPMFADYVSKLLVEFLNPQPDCVYLVPDGVDEFSLRRLHVALHRYLPQSTALPRSVAAVLGYACSVRKKKPCCLGTILLVVQQNAKKVIITQVEAVQADDNNPVADGIVWVRHPEILIELPREQVPQPRGLQSFDKLSQWLEWMTDAPSTSDNESATALSSDLIKQLQTLSLPERDVRILTVGPVIKDIIKLIKAEALNDSICAVGADLHRRFEQSHAGQKEAYIWKNHLPTLRAEFEDSLFRTAYLDLVDSEQTVPPRTRHLQIRIRDSFTLQAGQAEYSFRLDKGGDGSPSHYEMRLRSSHFPLAKDTSCRLELFYSYGADEPYEMYFVSQNGDMRVKAEWVEMRPTYEIGPVPEAPPQWSLESLRQHESQFGGVKDQLKYLQENWQTIGGTEHDAQDWLRLLSKEGYVKGTVIETIPIKNGDTIIILRLSDDRPASTLQSRLGEKFEQENWPLPQMGDVYYLKIKENAEYNRIYARDLIPEDVVHERCISKPWILEKIWSHGRCFGAGVPKELQVAFNGINSFVESQLNEETDTNEYRIKFTAYWLRMGKDAPPAAVNYLEYCIMPSLNPAETLTHERLRLFRCCGDVSLSWQRSLWKQLLQRIEREEYWCLWILSHVLWHEPGVVHLLSVQHVRLIAERLVAKNFLPKKVFQQGKDRPYVHPFYATSLELMLALLRLRESQDPEKRKLVALSSPLVKVFRKNLDVIIKRLEEAKAFGELRTWLKVSVPEKLAGCLTVPPIIFALRSYLTGNRDVSGIRIETDDDES